MDMAAGLLASAGFLVQALMLGAAEKLTACRHAFAARQMHAALRASHHVFCAPGLRRLPVTAHFPAVALEYPVSEQQPQHQKNDFCQASRPVRNVMSQFAATGAARRVPAGRQPTAGAISDFCRPERAPPRDRWQAPRENACFMLLDQPTIGRGERIRTSDSCVPNAVLYQAELHPDFRPTASKNL